MDLDFANSLGAVNYGGTTPGYEIAPTFVLVGSDGRIVWYDGKMRMGHVSTQEVLDKLREVLRKELGETNGTAPADGSAAADGTAQTESVAVEAESDTSEKSADESDPAESADNDADKLDK